MAKQKPIKIKPLVMPKEWDIKDCIAKAVEVAKEKQMGASFEYDGVMIIIYRFDPEKTLEENIEHQLQIASKKIEIS